MAKGAKRVKVGSGGALSRLYKQLTKPARKTGSGMAKSLMRGDYLKPKSGPKRVKPK